jgi:hypothetical protein
MSYEFFLLFIEKYFIKKYELEKLKGLLSIAPSFSWGFIFISYWL